MQVKFNDLYLQYLEIKENVAESLEILFKDSSYINGHFVESFENDFSKYIGTKYAIGVSNGTDAIMLAIKSLNLTGSTAFYIPANTFISTVLAAEQAIPNAQIKLVDCSKDFLIDLNDLEDKLKEDKHLYDNSVVIPVHLYGNLCDMDALISLSKTYQFKIVEDASQAHGAISNNKKAGSFGSASAFSLYPGKNLGAAGDAGIITTDDENIYKTIKKLRNLGSEKKYIHEIKGFNHRLDSLQAAILIEKLKKLDKWNNKRIEIAEFYSRNITNPKIKTPEIDTTGRHVYHIYCIKCENRNELSEYLRNNGIENGIHYPVPIEKMEIYEHLKSNNKKTREYSDQILSLPMHPFISKEQAEYVCTVINKFK